MLTAAAALARRLGRTASWTRVLPADAFFLAVESPAAPQNVGGVTLLDTSRRTISRQDLIDVVAARLGDLPRFRQRLSRHSRWRHRAWEEHPAIDWHWHVQVRDLAGPGGVDRLWALVARVQAEQLPMDRPLWRLLLVRGVAPGRTAVILVAHHAVADGIGVVAQALHLMEPAPTADTTARTPAGPGVLRAAVSIAVGIAQLATERAQGLRLPCGGTPERRFSGCHVPFERVRRIAGSYGVRVSDVVLCAVAGGLHRAWRGPSGTAPDRCRVAVPLTMRHPDTTAEGNVTAAVMVDLPIGPRPEADRLAEIARHSRRVHSGTRALATRFVMRRAGRAMPPPVHAAFARTFYGRRSFQAIISNLPGPDMALTIAGVPLTGAFPILPLAPGSPLAVGALSWQRNLHFGISVDPALLDDANVLAAAMREVLAELEAGHGG